MELNFLQRLASSGSNSANSSNSSPALTSSQAAALAGSIILSDSQDKSSLLQPKKSASPFTSLLYVHAKRLVITGNAAGTIRFFRRSTAHGAALPDLQEHKGQILSLILGPNPALLFSGSSDRTIKVWAPWSTETKTVCVQTLNGHGGSVLALSAFEDMLFSSATDNTVVIWKASEGREMLLYPWYVQAQRFTFGAWVTSLFFSTSSVRARHGELFGGTSQGEIWTIPLASGVFGEPWKWAHKHSLGVSILFVVTQDNFIVSLSLDGTMKLYDVQTLSLQKTYALEEPKNRFTAMSWDELHQELFLVDESGGLRVWSITKDKMAHSFRLENSLLGVVALPDSSQVLTMSATSINVYNVIRGIKYRQCIGHTAAVLGLYTFPPTHSLGGMVFSCSLDNSVKVWDLKNMTLIQTMEETESEICCMRAVDSCGILFSGCEDGRLRLWNYHTGGHSLSPSTHSNTITAVAYCPTTKIPYIATVSYDGCIGLWELVRTKLGPHNEESVRCRQQIKIKAHAAELYCVEFCEANTRLVVGGSGGVLKMYDLDNQSMTADLKGHTDDVTCLCIDMNLIFSGGDDCTIRIWDCLTSVQLSQLVAHTEPIKHLIIVPDYGFLVSCGGDNYIHVWDYAKKQILHTHSHDKDVLRTMIYSPERGELIAGTESGNLVLLPLLTTSSWKRYRQENPNSKGPELFQPWELCKRTDIVAAMRFLMTRPSEKDQILEEDAIAVSGQNERFDEQVTPATKAFFSKKECEIWKLKKLEGNTVGMLELWKISEQGDVFVNQYVTVSELTERKNELLEPLLKVLFDNNKVPSLSMNVHLTQLSAFQSIGFTVWTNNSRWLNHLPDDVADHIRKTMAQEDEEEIVRMRCVLRPGMIE